MYSSIEEKCLESGSLNQIYIYLTKVWSSVSVPVQRNDSTLPHQVTFGPSDSYVSLFNGVCVMSSQNVDPTLFTFPHPYGQLALGIFGEGFDLRTGAPSEDGRDAETRRERDVASRHRYGARQPRGHHVHRRQGTQHEGVPTLEGYEWKNRRGPLCLNGALVSI